mmetsp:Transcript_71837/g.126887  ORF Transcript_71837/g.126887 Transcript_71837/m.126887 type:complete len:289 (-) Transcript_71837:1808-2674(-)
MAELNVTGTSLHTRNAWSANAHNTASGKTGKNGLVAQRPVVAAPRSACALTILKNTVESTAKALQPKKWPALPRNARSTASGVIGVSGNAKLLVHPASRSATVSSLKLLKMVVLPAMVLRLRPRPAQIYLFVPLTANGVTGKTGQTVLLPADLAPGRGSATGRRMKNTEDMCATAPKTTRQSALQENALKRVLSETGATGVRALSPVALASILVQERSKAPPRMVVQTVLAISLRTSLARSTTAQLTVNSRTGATGHLAPKAAEVPSKVENAKKRRWPKTVATSVRVV